MKNLVVTCNNNVMYRSKALNVTQISIIFKLLLKHKRLLPNSYNRNKQTRKYCHNVDKKFQKLLGDKIFFSSYSAKCFKVEVI